jgi:hypothetical protein
MAFGVQSDDPIPRGNEDREIVRAVTGETFAALALVLALFAVFSWKMGLANTFGTMMGTAHDLLLNTVLFLMAVIIIAGAFTSLISEFGIVSVANRLLSPLMKPLFGLPGATSVGVVATYLSDNPAIMPLSADKGFLKYFKRWQVTTLVNLGTVFGMGLIVTTFMLAQSTDAEPLGRAVLLGNVGALLGGVVGVRLMGHFGKRKYGEAEDLFSRPAALPRSAERQHRTTGPPGPSRWWSPRRQDGPGHHARGHHHHDHGHDACLWAERGRLYGRGL